MSSRTLFARLNGRLHRPSLFLKPGWTPRTGLTMPSKSVQRSLRTASVTLIGLGLAFYLDTRPLFSEEAGRTLDDPLDALSFDALNNTNLHLINRPFGELIRAYLTYTASSSSVLVSVISSTLNALEWMRDSLPLGLGEIPWKAAEFVIRRTAFSIFAGGEDAFDTFPLLDRLAREGTSGLLCYSAEAEAAASGSATSEHLVPANVEETVRAINAAGAYPQEQHDVGVRPTWVAIKLTGLVRDPSVLERASEAITSSSAYQRGQRLPKDMLFPASPMLSEEDEAVLKDLNDSLMRFGDLACKLRVRVDIDAEQSWFQPAIDRFYELMAMRCNKAKDAPIVFQTYQTYRKDARERLHADRDWAAQAGISFGAKLVRGAYVDGEAAHAKLHKQTSPLWSSKAETDLCYNACAIDVADQVIKDLRDGSSLQTGGFFASHNAESTRLVLERFREAGLMRDKRDHLAVDERLRGRIVFGQLLGMADNLTATLTTLLVSNSPSVSPARETALPYVLKYIPYGRIDQVLPYLIRRAQENKAMLHGNASSRGGVRYERKAVGREIRRRLGL